MQCNNSSLLGRPRGLAFLCLSVQSALSRVQLYGMPEACTVEKADMCVKYSVRVHGHLIYRFKLACNRTIT